MSGGTYGALRVTVEPRYGREIRVGHCAVAQTTREIGINWLPTRRLPRGAKVSKVTSLDLVGRVRDAGIAPSMGSRRLRL